MQKEKHIHIEFAEMGTENEKPSTNHIKTVRLIHETSRLNLCANCLFAYCCLFAFLAYIQCNNLHKNGFMKDLHRKMLCCYFTRKDQTFKMSPLMTCTENISEMFQH